MKIDMHVHLADLEALQASRSVGLGPRSNGYLTRMLRCARSAESSSGADIGLNERWIGRLVEWVKQSHVDKVVLLAIDTVFDEFGKACPERSVLSVDNEFICSVAARHPEFLFGASIHPYRRDAVEELERLIKRGACLVKWIPSGQYIEPDNPKCFRFYEALAHYGIPLLSHTGVEHTLGCRRSSYNHPKRLVPALEKGVTVIAAHCGVHLFLHEPCFFKAWVSLARRYENLYGDSGAFSVVTRIPCLRRIIRDDSLREKLLYGSDFPGIPSPAWCWQLGLGKMRALSRMQNPLLRNMCVMEELGMPMNVFERAYERLGIGREVLSDES